MNLTELFDQAIDRRASDIHLLTGQPPSLRVSGDLVRCETEALDKSAMATLLEPFLSSRDRGRIEAGRPVEGILEHRDIAFVGIAFRCGEERVSTTFRLLSGGIPSMETAGGLAKDVLIKALQAPRGLILISGPTGSGKWTTGCAMVEEINRTKRSRIFVAESHPNFLWQSRESLVAPIHVGQDCESYEQAISNALQSDLDVFALDDIPNLSVLREVLMLADTGHLVIANVHAESTPDALRRLVTAGGAEGIELRRVLGENLILVTSQRLFRKIERGRAAAYECLLPTPKVLEALMIGDFERIGKLVETEPGCQSLTQAIKILAVSGTISKESAAAYQ